MNMVRNAPDPVAFAPPAHDGSQISMEPRTHTLIQQRRTVFCTEHHMDHNKRQGSRHNANYIAGLQPLMASASPLMRLIPAFVSLATVVLLMTLAFPLIAQSTTLRIRFANGKDGKPLHLKTYEEGIGRGFNVGGKYSVDRVDGDTLVVTLKDVSTFQFRSAGFEPCDVAKKNDAPPKYDVAQVVKEGIVAPNFCGPTFTKPVPGELLIYSRHEHWWEISKRVLQGLLICG